MDVKAKFPSIRPNHIFWTVVVLLAAISAVAALSTHRLLDQYSASTRSQQSLLELDRFLSGLKDVEAGARGYALTRDPAFLEAYRDGQESLSQRRERLRALARSEDELASGLSDLERATDQRVSRSGDLVGLVSSGAGEEEIAASTLLGKTAMDEVTAKVSQLFAAQQQMLERRRSSVERQATVASIALAVGVAASLLVLIWLFRLSNREIVRRRDVEQQLRQLNTELEQRVLARSSEVEQARQLLDTVIDNMPDTVFLKDVGEDFKYVMINAAGEKLIGRDRNEVLGHFDHELFAARDAVLCRQEDQKVAKTLELSLVAERELTTADGKRLVETRKLPVETPDGQKTFILGIVRDLTDRKALETQVREMQRLESVGRLTGGVAHDFNNLLAVIMGSVELVREKLPDDSDSAAIADEALDASRRGAELVRRLLAFARKQHLEPVAVDLNERVPNVVPLLQRTLGENVRVQVKSTDELWRARIDPTQVDDALVNMAINARDAMPKGGTLTIETANVILDEDYAAQHVEVESGEYVMLAVSDTGTGMAPDVVARAFEPFFTTKSEGQGTGLGLSQVFGWVKQSGGHIKIYSELAHGTTIKLYLPRAADEKRDLQAPEAAGTDGLGHETILLVEDNPNVRRTVMRQLNDLGYVAIEADDAGAALEKIRSGVAFDLLLTDVVMPGGMNGYELATEAERLRPGTKVLFTSGYTELAANELEAGRKGPLISKPYSKRDLGRAIRSALEDETK